MTKNTIDVSNELEDAIKYAATNILCLFFGGDFVGRMRSMRIIRVENCCIKVLLDDALVWRLIGLDLCVACLLHIRVLKLKE